MQLCPYDDTPNPLVALDLRRTLPLLEPEPGELVLDAGCGTGRNLGALLERGCRPVGLDLSLGMLGVARRRFPSVPLAQADLEAPLPLRPDRFDAVLCALVGEHLSDLHCAFAQTYAALRPGGRLVFSVFHPELAAAGIEANFERSGVEYRLGAERHSVADYLAAADDAGFGELEWSEHAADAAVSDAIPWVAKYVGTPLLLLIRTRRPSAG